MEHVIIVNGYNIVLLHEKWKKSLFCFLNLTRTSTKIFNNLSSGQMNAFHLKKENHYDCCALSCRFLLKIQLKSVRWYQKLCNKYFHVRKYKSGMYRCTAVYILNLPQKVTVLAIFPTHKHTHTALFRYFFSLVWHGHQKQNIGYHGFSLISDSGFHVLFFF